MVKIVHNYWVHGLAVKFSWVNLAKELASTGVGDKLMMYDICI